MTNGIKCYTCKYHYAELDLPGIHIECHIPRPDMPDMPSTWWISKKYDKWGHIEYLK